MASNRRLLFLVFGAIAVAAYFLLAPSWPSDQTVHFVLGDAAVRVTELDVRYGPGALPGQERSGDDDWARGATFRYARGSAPRIVSHEPRLVSGDYVVEMELELASDTGTPERVKVRRNVALRGGSTSIDLSHALSESTAR